MSCVSTCGGGGEWGIDGVFCVIFFFLYRGVRFEVYWRGLGNVGGFKEEK